MKKVSFDLSGERAIGRLVRMNKLTAVVKLDDLIAPDKTSSDGEVIKGYREEGRTIKRHITRHNVQEVQ